jgi:hypothetical protein
MPILFRCPSCANEIEAPDDRAGSGIRCSTCGNISKVPWDGAPGGHDHAPEEEALPEADELPETGKPPELGRDEPEKDTRWILFARGCELTKVGIAVELGGVAILLLATALKALEGAGVIETKKDGKSGAFLLLPAATLLIGSCFLALGRTKQAGLPRGTTGASIFVMAACFGWLRFALLLGATWALVMGVGEDGAMGRVEYFDWAFRLYTFSIVVGLVAELSPIPGFGLLGSELPSRTLRRRVAVVVTAIQLLVAMWAVLVIVYSYLELRLDTGPSRTSSRARQPFGSDGELGKIALVLVTLFLLNAAYSYLHYSLYSTGQRVVLPDDRGD